MSTIILLNGIGSAGKSSIAKALQQITREPFLHFSMDVFLEMLPPRYFDHPEGLVFETIEEDGHPSVVIHEGARTLGFGAELAARIQEELFYDLEAPVLRATGFDTPYPPARLEKLWLPGVDRLLDCVEKAMRS